MASPTDPAIDQAAETLCRMAEVPGFDRGRAIFKRDFKRVEWYSPLWGISDFENYPFDLETHIPCGLSYDSREELFAACRHEIKDALADREVEIGGTLQNLFPRMKEAKEGRRPDDGIWTPDDLRQMAGQLDDDVARRRWLEQINAEWPPLSLAAGGENR
jgi:hypothetical protein